MASAWNVALPHSGGQVLCLLDADDLFRPTKLAAVVRAFREWPDAGLLVHSMTVIDGDGHPILKVPYLTRFEHGWIADRVVRRGGRWRYMPTSALAFRRELCPYVFPLDERLFFRHAESLIVTLGPLVTEVTAIEESLTGYRVHGANRTGGHAHDRKTARRAVDNVTETIEGVNARLAAMALPQRLELAQNLEFLQAKLLLSLLEGERLGTHWREYAGLVRALARDDLYGLSQKALGAFVYGTALLLPVRQRPWWLEQTLGYSPLKQRARKLADAVRQCAAGGDGSPRARRDDRGSAGGVVNEAVDGEVVHVT
jgi:glycosyltransferase involved in cell wall biosynthesis